MKVYIAGPMTGLHHYNHASFMAAKDTWESDGWEVWTPFDSSNVVWRSRFGRDFDPAADRCEYGEPALCEMLAEDAKAIMRADAVALLPGWEKSKGTAAEIVLANLGGKRLFLHCEEHGPRGVKIRHQVALEVVGWDD